MALAAYRNLMRAARIAFQGDAPVLAAAQEQIRTVFRQQASLSPSEPSTADAIQHAQDVAQFLRANIVQGKRIEGEKDMYRTLKHGGLTTEMIISDQPRIDMEIRTANPRAHRKRR
ncbi:hypothetical protein E4U43_006826 [Claviceps pusilla]|uniref:Mitochondrial zinc maintenance protein 1, mitochondrial n=1 Tax=Claviceps pusilla TaxID=123648 RepID=A0A9P7NFL3_9HYPO|nr:hypothetical protein E4U43_006826 [Claviceps pusilla]